MTEGEGKRNAGDEGIGEGEVATHFRKLINFKPGREEEKEWRCNRREEEKEGEW